MAALCTLVMVVAALSDTNYVRRQGQYCIGNVHPNISVFVSNSTNVSECQAHCDYYSCSCFDVLEHTESGQWGCRVTITSETKTSSEGYNAFVKTGNNPSQYVATVNFGQTPRPFSHFWKSCGWCPPDPHPLFPEFFLTEDTFQNHLLISSVPNKGIEFVRIHFLLDLIKLVDNNTLVSNTESIVFLKDLPSFKNSFWAGRGLNYSALDAAMEQLVSFGLHPGFEIMGNPGNFANRSDRLFTSFGDHTQILAWNQFINDLVQRYVTKFGLAEVQRWRWETWNEPDGECGKGLEVDIDCDINSFMSYVDASVNAVKKVDASLIIGGPASDGGHEFLFGMIQHCINGTNAITGKIGCGPVDFINAHLKGDQDTATITLEELPIALKALAQTKGTVMNDVAWGNDEGDPKVGWSHDYPWRADSRYAAMVPKVIHQHQESFIEKNGIKYDVLSNDNGFMSYPDNNHSFTQRTLVARWVYNNTNPKTVAAVRKPVLNTMGLLALLGNDRYPAEGLLPALTSKVGVLATTIPDMSNNSTIVTTLVWFSADSENITSTAPSSNITLNMDSLPFSSSDDVMVAVYVLDELHGNSHTVYKQQGSPRFPSAMQLEEMRNASEIPMLPGYPKAAAVTSKGLSITIPMALPSVHVIQLCKRSPIAPPKIANVQLHKTPTSQPHEVIVRWDGVPNTVCIRTYIVKCSTNGEPSTRCNFIDSIFTSFLHTHSGELPEKLCYSVSAVDVFGQEGEESDSVCL
eukprot:m.13604 g.13604  ORF g.13604 m.13604 type:complete len:747 (-) comp4884_c0_seq1:96-2336(-)